MAPHTTPRPSPRLADAVSAATAGGEVGERLVCADNRVEIIVGDCRETLAALPEASVDCIVTSPPYYGLRDYGCDGQIGLEQTPAAYVAEIVAVMRACRRVLKPGGTLWVNIGDSYAGGPQTGKSGSKHGSIGSYSERGRGAPIARMGADTKPKDLLMIPASVAIALRADGWWLRSEIIWHKPNPMPESVRDRPTKAHEQVFMLSNAERYWYDKDAIAEPATYAGKVVTLGEKSLSRGQATGASVAASGNAIADSVTVADLRNARTVWTIATEPCDLAHFALMPTDLARRCILAGCPKGGVVLDPFGGGGTTGLTAARHGRRAILCELNPEYAAIARQRIAREWREAVKPTDPMDAGPLFMGAAE